MVEIVLCVKNKLEKVVDNFDARFIDQVFSESGVHLSSLQEVESFRLYVHFQKTSGVESMDFEPNFPEFASLLTAETVAFTPRPTVFWEVMMDVYPFGVGISEGRAGKQRLRQIPFDSQTGIDGFRARLASIKGYTEGHLSVWYLSDGVAQMFDDQSAISAITGGNRDVFLVVGHASYSSITKMSVFPQFGNIDQLCPKWRSASAQEIFNVITATPDTDFDTAVKQLLTEEQAKQQWKDTIRKGYDYLALLQPIFQPPPHNRDYPGTQRRTITDPVLLVASAYLEATVDWEVELWSDTQLQFPSNVMGHGPLDYLLYRPGRQEGSSSLGKRGRPQEHMVLTVVATEGAGAISEAQEGEENEAQTGAEAEEKTRNALAAALAQVFSQAHDSMLEGAGKLEKEINPAMVANRIAKKRFTILSTGESYYFFMILWPNAGSKPTVHYLGMYPLRVFPQIQPPSRDSGQFMEDGKLKEVSIEEYEVVVAAVVTCMKGAYTPNPNPPPP